MTGHPDHPSSPPPPGSIPVTPVTMGDFRWEGLTEDEGPSYLPLPHTMETYQPPVLPDPGESTATPRALSHLARLQSVLEEALEGFPPSGTPLRIDLSALDEPEKKFLSDLLGEGEVSARISSDPPVIIQETILAGVFRVRAGSGEDFWEIGDIPQAIRTVGNAGSSGDPDGCQTRLEEAPMARALLGEILRNGEREDENTHIINLSSLPVPPTEYQALEEVFGRPGAILLSRGYGNCRVESTSLRQVWHVRHYNSEDRVILDTVEVGDVPASVKAAREDLEDSLQRLLEIREWLHAEEHDENGTGHEP